MDLYIIAGPNGVGKTTFARKFLPKYANCKNFVNADLIAQGMSLFSPEAAAVRAGRLVLKEIDCFAQRKVSSASRQRSRVAPIWAYFSGSTAKATGFTCSFSL